MKLAFNPAVTSVIIHVFAQDSTATDGSGKTALIHSDITAYYVRAGGTLTAMTMETISSLGTWASTGDNYLGFKKLHDTNAPGGYELDLPNNILAAGANQVTLFLRASGALFAPIEIQLANVPAKANVIADGTIAAATLATDMNTYQAKIGVVDDDGGTADRYTVAWFKNGQPVTSGITTPLIQVIKDSDGSDLVASTAMTQIASTGRYRYVESTNRIVDGVAYTALATATIDGSARTWPQPIGRDS